MSDPLTAAKRPMYTEADQFLQADIATVIDEIARLFDLRTDAVSTYELLRSIRGNAESQQERIREQDAELAQARAANAELVEALSVLWRWNATDEFDHLEIEQLIYGFATAQQRVYDLVMRYGVQYERSVAQATAQPADGQQQAGG